jgi:hypothetical protein
MIFDHLVEGMPLCTLSLACYDATAVLHCNSWRCCSCGIVGSSVALLVVGKRPLWVDGVRDALMSVLMEVATLRLEMLVVEDMNAFVTVLYLSILPLLRIVVVVTIGYSILRAHCISRRDSPTCSSLLAMCNG